MEFRLFRVSFLERPQCRPLVCRRDCGCFDTIDEAKDWLLNSQKAVDGLYQLHDRSCRADDPFVVSEIVIEDNRVSIVDTISSVGGENQEYLN